MRGRAHHAIPLVRLLASAFLFALLLTLAGCGTDPLVSPYTGTPTDAQRETLREMETRMAEIRGLEPLGEVDYEIVPRGSLDRVLDDYNRRSVNYATEESRTRFETQPVYELLGFISPGTDLVELRARNRVEGVAALYDRGRHTIVFVDNRLTLDGPTEVILAHEFVHALQDQHFYRHEVDDLAAANEGDWHLSWDADLALRALVEGDATVAMRQYAAMSPDLREPWAAYRGEGAESTDGRLPDGLRKEYAFPYEAGAAFVEALVADGGWEAVNEAYSRPPTTTEQILHPDKYLAGEVGEGGR
jgi:hypothetical protein